MLRLYALLNKILYYLLLPILMLLFGGPKKSDKIWKHDDPILEICAVDLAEKIRNREVSKNIVKRTVRPNSNKKFAAQSH